MADVGMEMRVMGSPTYYPLIEAGNNWYDSKASCEFILDDTEELVFIVSTYHRPEKRRVGMMLPGIRCVRTRLPDYGWNYSMSHLQNVK